MATKKRRPTHTAQPLSLKLQIEMLPTTAWGKNLRALLPRSKWDKLRKSVHEKNGMKCQICGSSDTLHCHEEWTFDEATEVQKLVGLSTICSLCHHVAHLGRSKQLTENGSLDINSIVEHFLRVNGVDLDTFEQHESDALDRFLRLSSISWTQDYGDYAELVEEATSKARGAKFKNADT